MKRVLVLLFALLLSLSIYGCNASLDEGSTILGVEINPSIEFLLNEKGNVISLQLNNEDAEIVASDLTFIGLHYNEAVTLFLNEAVKAGYIEVNSTDNDIVITVGDEDEAKKNELQVAVENAAQSYLEENKIGGAIFGGEIVYEDLATLAAEYEITIGKVRMIYTVQKYDETQTFAELAELSMKELAVLVKEAHQASMTEFVSNRQAEAEATKEQMMTNAEGVVDAFRASVENGEINTPNYEQIKAEHLANIDQIIEQYRAMVDSMKNKEFD